MANQLTHNEFSIIKMMMIIIIIILSLVGQMTRKWLNDVHVAEVMTNLD